MKKTLPNVSSRHKSITLNVNVLLLLLLVVSLFVASRVFFSPKPGNTQTSGATYYVSTRGNSADGRSWATAWRELNAINWSVLRPGDTVLIDGGTTACPRTGQSPNGCGMVYKSTLNVAANGTSGNPITLKLASESGRNGTVVIDGGITRWPRCSEYRAEPNEAPPSSPSSSGATRTIGVTFGNSQWVVLDGTKWGGIEIRNHTRYGMSFGNGQHVSAKYMKIYNNTDPVNADNHAVGATQGYLSNGATLARSEIFRNGQDSVRGAGDNFIMEENYIHDQYCNHPDGIQSFIPTSNSGMPSNSGKIENTVIRRNIFENVGLQSIFMGENSTHDSWVDGALIHDNLILNGGDVIKSKNGKSVNWTIRNNTLDQSTRWGIQWCCANPGALTPMVVKDNVFMNLGRNTSDSFQFSTGRGPSDTTGGKTEYSGNCELNIKAKYGQYVVVRPNITVNGSATTLVNRVKNISTNAHDFDYSLKTDAEALRCAGKGSSITSVAQLLDQTSTLPTPVPTSTITATPTPVPTATITATPTPTISVSTTPVPSVGLVPVTVSGLSFEAEAATGSALRAPLARTTLSGVTALRQSSTITDPVTTGMAAYKVTIPTSGNYVVKMTVNASSLGSNSVWVTFDSMPSDSNSIWHIPVTDGFTSRTVSWQGTGTVEVPQFTPKYFNLSAGAHTLYLAGRESNVYVDKIEVVAINTISFQAESGSITSPLRSHKDGSLIVVSQNVQQLDLSNTGKLTKQVNVPVTGSYIVKMKLRAPDLSSNSLLVNFDQAPSTPAMVWHIPTTSGYQLRTLSWQGSGSESSSEFSPKVFYLTEGNHTLYVYGREKNVRIDTIEVVPVTPGVLGDSTEANVFSKVVDWFKNLIN